MSTIETERPERRELPDKATRREQAPPRAQLAHQDQPEHAAGAVNAVRRPPGAIILGVAMVILLAAMVAAIGIGPLQLSPASVVEILTAKIGMGDLAAHDPAHVSVVWEIRLPRALLAAAVGASLAISGAALQGLFGNSLADPGVIGVSSGASLGAICAIVLGLTFFGSWTVPVMAFLFGIVTTGLIYVLAQPGKNGGTVQLLLVGIAITAMVGAVNGFFTYIADTSELESITFWSMGSLNSASWQTVAAGIPFAVFGIVAVMWLAKPLDVLALGERQAHHVGLNVRRTRLLLIVSTALAVGAAVAMAGTIGFIGLVIPHIVRLIVGPGHRWLLPISAVGGAIMLELADIGARTLNPPSEIPIGLFTGVVGGPFFLWLLARRRKQARI